jgi:polyprenyl P-hydroxybenzoate/phenylacrylic acid decarboxylase-like protein
VGISGASAPHLGIRLLEQLRRIGGIESHLVITDGARRTIQLETERSVDDVAALADHVHDANDLGAPISSGSFRTHGMVVIPCSMSTLAAVATGNTQNLLTRAADVALKERRRLVLVTRESPLNLVHINNMQTVTLAGATVMPPVPGFYHRPRSVDDILDHIVGRVLDQFDIDNSLFQRWTGSPSPAADDAS